MRIWLILLALAPFLVSCAAPEGSVRIEHIAVKQESHLGNITCKLEGVYPAIKTTGNLIYKRISRLLKEHIYLSALRTLNNCPESIAELLTEEAKLVNTVQIAHTIHLNQNNLLSMEVRETEYISGALSSVHTRNGLTINTLTGQRMTLKDIVLSTTILEQFISEQMKQQQVDGRRSNNEYSFYLTPRSLVLFNVFESPTLWEFEVHIPYTDILDALRTDSAVAPLLKELSA